MYGSEVLFIGKEILDFETVYLSFLKNMLGVKQQTTSATIYGDTGRYPFFLKHQILALKYWILLISLPRSCYLRIVYNSLASLDFNSFFTNLAFMRKLPSFTNFAFMRIPHVYMQLLQWRYFISCMVENRQPEWSVTWTQCNLAFLICGMCACA